MLYSYDWSKKVPAVVDEDRRFDLHDNKGRQIGIALFIERRELTESPRHGYDLPRGGEWFICAAHATRDGLRYGASNGTHFEPTLDAAKAWIEARAASTLKTYQRKFS